MTKPQDPPAPKLLKIRWVCGVCLTVLHARLEVSWKCEKGSVKGGGDRWHPIATQEPMHCGIPMLVLGEPKTDVHGLRGFGLVIDPLDDMRPLSLSTEGKMRGGDLVTWRKRYHYTQAELMQELGIRSRQTISTWENSVDKIPRMVELALFALAEFPECRLSVKAA